MRSYHCATPSISSIDLGGFSASVGTVHRWKAFTRDSCQLKRATACGRVTLFRGGPLDRAAGSIAAAGRGPVGH